MQADSSAQTLRPAQLEESERLAALPDCGRVAGFAGLALEGDLCWLLAERVPGTPLRDAIASGRDYSWRAGCATPLTSVHGQTVAFRTPNSKNPELAAGRVRAGHAAARCHRDRPRLPWRAGCAVPLTGLHAQTIFATFHSPACSPRLQIWSWSLRCLKAQCHNRCLRKL